MYKYPEEAPQENQYVIVYDKNGRVRLCRYVKIDVGWFRKKYEMHFINMLNRMIVLDKNNIIGWNGIPTEEHTI